MKHLVLTGCAGFIGLNALEQLSSREDVVKKYDRITSIDKMGYATEFNTTYYYDILKRFDNLTKITSIESDINSNEFKHKKFTHLEGESIDIIDFASESHVDNSIKDPFHIYNQNCSIPSNLLAWIGKDKWKYIKTYYHISTDEIYSEIPLDKIRDERNWFDITTPIKPNNPYSASKAAQDCFLMSLKHTYGLNVKFIRMANQQPGRYQHKEKMLMASVIRCLNNESVKIYGNGENVRQWTPVEITANIIIDILDNKIQFEEDVIHIANYRGIYTNNQIIDMLKENMESYGYTLKKEYIKDRLGHDTAYALMTKPVIDRYFDKCDVKEYMKKCIDYCLENKDKFIL